MEIQREQERDIAPQTDTYKGAQKETQRQIERNMQPERDKAYIHV